MIMIINDDDDKYNSMLNDDYYLPLFSLWLPGPDLALRLSNSALLRVTYDLEAGRAVAGWLG